ncbi:ATP-binding protein [Microbacteriaceae bacterium VKM Ac-2855]|nr:ATP-binding protein [Microbacteriaceae bacterium VKM Ac-2855]
MVQDLAVPITTGAFVIALVALVIAVVRIRMLRRRVDSSTRAGHDRDFLVAEQTARLRIVRELDDVLVRDLGRLATDLEGAALAVERDPAAARRTIDRAGSDARSAIAELRRIGSVARDGESAAEHLPTLPPLPELVRIMEEGGLVVRFDETGTPFPLRQGAEIAVFRILERALGNALQHGGAGTEARVALRWSETGLQLHIDDDGIRAAAARNGVDRTDYDANDDARALTESIAGAELAEMRERAELFGGSVDAHRVPGVGFSVAAFFPTLRHHNGVHGVDLGR